MTSLDELRARVATGARRGYLDEIWRHHLCSGEWITVRQLHHPRRAEEVRAALEALGGSVVWKDEDLEDPRYQLTLLGILLTSDGENLEDLLVGYLEHVRRRYEEDFAFKVARQAEVADDLGLDDERARILGELIYLGNCAQNPINRGRPWSYGVPYNLDSYPHDRTGLSERVRDRALEHYAADMPVDGRRRSERLHRMLYGGPQPRGECWFIGDGTLREQLESDWAEAQAVHERGARKATVILCGGVLEGLLLDALAADAPAARSAYRALHGKAPQSLDQWGLAELINVAERLGVLDKGALHLGRAVTEFRNLVHPGRQLRTQLRVDEDEATVAIGAVRMCLRALSARAVNASTAPSAGAVGAPAGSP